MADRVYKKMEIVGTSTVSTDDAIRNALKRASDSVRNLRWFEVVEVRGAIEGSTVGQWQVTVKVGFTLED